MQFEMSKLHQGVSYEQYAEVQGIRSSWLHHLKRSPAHFQAALKAPQKKSDAMAFGTLFHSMIENPTKFMDSYVVAPKLDLRKNVDKAKMADFMATVRSDQVVVKDGEIDDLIGMAKAFSSHSLLKHMLKNSIHESSLWVKDPDNGELLQCRPDFITEHGYCVDIKTCQDARPSKFTNAIFSDRDRFYILQAAHYNHCLKIAGINKRDNLTIVAIESSAPYGINIYPLDIGCLGPGEQWRAELTALYHDCKKKKKWPCYPEQVIPITPPEWTPVPELEDL